MKKLLSIIVFTLSICIVSCKKDISILNNNTINPEKVSSQALFANACLNLSNVMASTNVNENNFRLWTQYWTETIYRDETRYNINGRSIADRWWATFYRDIIKDLNEASAVTVSETGAPYYLTEAQIKNRNAINEILTVYSYYTLLATFGDIPYTEALDINNTQPKYDKASDVFAKISTRLDAALANIDTDEEGYGSADLILAGKMSLWQTFAYSLKMRMGMLVADANPTLAQTMISDAADHVISSNDNNITFKYLAAPPNTNPVWVDLIQSGRHDFVAAKPIVDSMNNHYDPRRKYYFSLNSSDTFKGQKPGSYVASFLSYSSPSDKISDALMPHTFFSYSEMEFLKAEAIERHFLTGSSADAETHYNSAITASITEWGGTAADAATYLSQTAVAYSTAPGDFKQKIGTQSWIAFYNRGFDAFTQLRRLDYPKLALPNFGATNPFKDGETPGLIVRMTYPVIEQNVNKTNYNNAVASVGNDWITQKLWFDLF